MDDSLPNMCVVNVGDVERVPYAETEVVMISYGLWRGGALEFRLGALGITPASRCPMAPRITEPSRLWRTAGPEWSSIHEPPIECFD